VNKKIRHILVPVDFSKYAAYALETAVQISKKNQARITILYTAEENPKKAYMMPDELHLSESTYIGLLEKLKNKIQETHQIEIGVKAEIGIASNTIVMTAQTIGCDLIVIGTTMTEYGNFFLDSDIYSIIKQAPCSILTVPGGNRNTSFTKMVFPEKIMNDVLEKYEFLKNIVQKNDVVLEIHGLVQSNTKIDMNDLNAMIISLEHKLSTQYDENLGLNYFVNAVNETANDIRIKLITIQDHKNSEAIPMVTPKRQSNNYSDIHVLSLSQP